ncbi:hypothetical protein N8697_01370 [bacterium]|nr:hypothetical protein [bacterium]MDC0319234.1 hypothetical protein [Verrucomicrobiota bacterium]
MKIEKMIKLILIATLLLPVMVDAFPPAPHHTFYGMVRDEYGRPLEGEKVEVLFEASTGRVIRADVAPSTTPGINYWLVVPMDSGATANLYHPAAMRMAMPYKIRVRIGARVYLPIEMVGDLGKMGQPGEETLLNLTLGEDTDGDGLPDAWERALLAQGQGLGDINPNDDTDGDGMSNLNEYISGNYAFDKEDGLKLDIVQKAEAGTVLEFMGIQGRTYTVKGSPDLKAWSDLAFQVDGEEGEFENVRASKVRKFRITVPSEEAGATVKFFKLMVQ